jgi:1-acyl-sn-glycerol-3-phosphate acyltransferase
MYPPFFLHDRKKRRFDQWAMAELVELCREGEGRLIGFHPEGTRNRGPDPWSFLPAQPGIGRLILEARPQVIPLYIGGPPSGLGQLLARRRRGGEPIRLWFGPALDYSRFLDLPSTGRTHRAVAEYVMSEIATLAGRDREEFGGIAGMPG